MNHTSITDIRALLDAHGIALKKRFGQNFLVDDNIRRRIVTAIVSELERCEPGEADSGEEPAGPQERRIAEDGVAPEIWEIGPGIGSLTDLLGAVGRPLRLFEIDHGLITILRERYGASLAVEAGDALQTLSEAAKRHRTPSMIVGNLPYASASAIVARIIETPIPVGTMLFLVQKELAERFTAAVGSKEYSALSVLVQNHYTTTTLFHVGGNAFYPRPEVGSTVIVMRERVGRLSPELSATTSVLARTAFAQRRKAIRNSLKDYRDGMKRCGIDEGLRPERLSPADFVRLAREVNPEERAREDNPAQRVTRDRTPS